MFHHWYRCCLVKKSGMNLKIAFGLILGLSLFLNKLDINPAQVKVSCVSKCTEMRMISEACSSQVCSLTWRHLSCHDVDAQEAQTLWGQHNYLPVEKLGWLDQPYLFSLNPLYMQPVLQFSTHHIMIYDNEKTLLMKNWHCVGWPGIRFPLKITRLDCDKTLHQHVNL